MLFVLVMSRVNGDYVRFRIYQVFSGVHVKFKFYQVFSGVRGVKQLWSTIDLMKKRLNSCGQPSI